MPRDLAGVRSDDRWHNATVMHVDVGVAVSTVLADRPRSLIARGTDLGVVWWVHSQPSVIPPRRQLLQRF